MSIELMKQKFMQKPITSQLEEKVQDKEKIIKNLENKNIDLSNKIYNLENQKSNLLKELKKARNFEEGTFTIKEKDFLKEIKLKDREVRRLKSQFNPFNEKINEQKERLSYKDEVIEKAKKLNKELNEKLNKLNYKLNHETKNSKKVVNEVKMERKRVYQEYINNLDTYEKALVSKNDKIDNYKTKLKESLDKLKEANNLIINLKKDIKVNKNVRQELREKKEEITNLNGQVYSLSKEVTHLSSLSQENSILEAKLEKAQSFQDIIVDRKDEFDKFLKETNNLSTFKLINVLTDVSRKKQGIEKLTWNDWLKIPESNYLFNLDENIAKKIFNESQMIIDKSRISMKGNLNEARHYSAGRGDAPDNRLLPLKFNNIKGYYSSLELSDGTGNFPADGGDITTWQDLSVNKNHLVTPGSTHDGTTSGLSGSATIGAPSRNTTNNSVFFDRLDGESDADYLNFKNKMTFDEMTVFMVVETTGSTGTHIHKYLESYDDDSGVSSFTLNNSSNMQYRVRGDDGTTDTGNVTIGDGGGGTEAVKHLITITKTKFSTSAPTGSILKLYVDNDLEDIIDGTGYNDKVPINVDHIAGSATGKTNGFKGHWYELALYDRVLTDNELSQSQAYYIERTNI
jgi:hypothetical protein